MKKQTRIILAVLIGTALTALSYYIMLPPLNLYSTDFWLYLLLVICFYSIPLGVIKGISVGKKGTVSKPQVNKIFLIVAAVPLAVLILGSIISSTFFNAQKYATVIDVQEAVFSEDMPETNTVTNISLMDGQSAAILGNRTLGALSDVVSQYDLSGDYNQINYRGTPKKVANLEYVDIFRWFNNMENGIPGYVMVDPVNNNADYIKLDQPMRYVDSGFLSDDLMRKLRFSYPTKIFSTVNFEVDDDGNPFFIVSCTKPRVGLFGAMDVNEVIIFNPCDGSSELYPVDKAPAWLDNVYDGSLACQKYDWYGTLSGGFWNSVFGQKNCKQTTEDYGYIVIGDDVWYFTGVTSVTSDESNIGFIISNARTGEYKYYPVIGAEEYSAMGAAEGKVQEKGYVASFPSLINVKGQPTYIMVLKDQNGYVMLYALVNVKTPNIVATGVSQQDAKEAYLQLLMDRGEISDLEEEKPVVETQSADITVTDVRLATLNGNSVVYITAEDGIVYKGMLSDDESLILVTAGQKLTVEYGATDHEKIRLINAWKPFVEPTPEETESEA
ncbi:MAG: hypothetical protein IJW90_03070 [Clostridia bacterium]|nr:hypothetical protein [Clostridia bacterium]